MVIVYGLIEERILILFTNKKQNQQRMIKIVRMYFYRYKIEEYSRTIKGISVLNLMLTIHLDYIGKLV